MRRKPERITPMEAAILITVVRESASLLPDEIWAKLYAISGVKPASQEQPKANGSGLKLGEFLFYKDEAGVLHCKRHGQDWREFLGDHAITALFDYAQGHT